ncbi:Hypothetical protein NTJ_05499 [Nesidiocoris tenuis]|uniref:Uncharacterized protein n=2 Tax=Nesidiocoris tenuis TaxID=355587 RepID=A0ABN7AMN3_9HEMI|nr:Hypothetical protein NTJ_05499 [Nesidiocoris tenuis]
MNKKGMPTYCRNVLSGSRSNDHNATTPKNYVRCGLRVLNHDDSCVIAIVHVKSGLALAAAGSTELKRPASGAGGRGVLVGIGHSGSQPVGGELINNKVG